MARGIECLVVDPASLKVNRRGRRAKTDRIDVGMLLRALIAWLRGDRHVWSVVRIPSVDEEDVRRSHRERDRLIHERTSHINRIKGLLFAQGIRDINIKTQYKKLNRERDEAPTPCKATEKKRVLLTQLKSIGPAISAVMSREVYYRQFNNRRQVAGFLGLATSPYDSGDTERSQGISRTGRGQVRALMIQAAWLWTRHQPKSTLTRWFLDRT